jgi:DNA primase
VDVILDYVKLTKTGANYKGLCPFHQEKTPSFFVNEGKKIFHCFGCGASGDVFEFLMKHENISFLGAVRMLAKRQGIELPEKPLSREQQRNLSEREELFSINGMVAQFYNNLLLNDLRGKKARDYLHKRDISQKTIKDYQLGFAPDEWRLLVNYLKTKKFSIQNAQKIGLIIQKENGQHYDRFRNRIIFPIFNVSNHIIGFGGRILETGEPKYLNSSESVLYNKRHNLYGLHVAAKHIVQQQEAIVVEGYFDLLTMHQAGIKNTVAPLGTALTEQQIHILKRYTTNIITVFDSDNSGQKAMIRSLEPFLENGISPKMIPLPSDHDPDSYIRQYGEQQFLQSVTTAVPLMDFVIEQSIKSYPIHTPPGKVRACEELVPLLKKLNNDIERDLYIQKVAQVLGIKETHIISKMNKLASIKSGHSVTTVDIPASHYEAALSPAEHAERLIIELMLLHPDIISIIEANGFIEEFFSPDLQQVGHLLCAQYAQKKSITVPELLRSIQDEQLKQLITGITVKEACGSPLAKVLEDCIQKIRLQKIKYKIEEVQKLLKTAEEKKDEAASSKFQLDWQKLIEEKKRILQFRITV